MSKYQPKYNSVRSEWIGCPEWERMQAINCKLFDTYGENIVFYKEDTHIFECYYCRKSMLSFFRNKGLIPMYPRIPRL
jgi:hypothetical protein